jgi:hypothetical protein
LEWKRGEPTPTEEDGETLCKLVLERLPYDLGVIVPFEMRTNVRARSREQQPSRRQPVVDDVGAREQQQTGAER